ncbi:MAG TPA: YihY/virulence factor BrkB family protein [Rickettsiales bacterium]|nr:YihY/virulence factor BrkB family protein [Rickettsiales bacterium]
MKIKFKKLILSEKILNFLKKLWFVIYKSIFTFNIHGGYESAGNLAFIMVFALFPFMIFFTILIGYLGQTEIGIRLISILNKSLPKDIAETLLPVIDNVINTPKSSIISIASLTLIWSASSLVQELKYILDKALKIRANKPYLLNRLSSIIKFLIITSIIIFSIFFTIVFPKITFFIGKFIPIDLDFSNALVLFKPILIGFFMLLFIISIYYIIPSKIKRLKDIIWGALLTVFGWSISLKLLTFYLTKMAQFQVVYGSLAGIIITLFFFQIMAIILIFSAEFNQNIKEIFKN